MPALRPAVTLQSTPSHVLGAHFPQPTPRRRAHSQWFARVTKLCEALALPLAAALVAALFYGARQPIAVGLFPAPWDKLAHTALFASLAGLLACSRPRRYASPRWLLLCALAATGIGAADELHQLFLPGRSGGLDDLAADAAGAFLGVAAASTLGHTVRALATHRRKFK